MSAFRSPPSANNPERAPCFTPTDGAARRGPPRCAENCDPFLLISSHSTPEHALARGGRNLASPHLLDRQGCTGWPASGPRSAYAGGLWPPLSSWRLLIPLSLWEECARAAHAGVRASAAQAWTVVPAEAGTSQPVAPGYSRVRQSAPKWATSLLQTPRGPGPTPLCPRWRCAVADQRTRPWGDGGRGACHTWGGKDQGCRFAMTAGKSASLNTSWNVPLAGPLCTVIVP